jgi:hypothetical protein
MFERCSCLVESLEPRCLLSAHHAVSGKTLAAGAAALTPAPPAVSVKRHHHAPAASAPSFEVAGGLPGIWSGGQSTADENFSGEVSLTVFQNKAGEYYALLRFDRPGGEFIQLQSQFSFHADGQFSLQIITARMAVKFSGTIFNHATRTSILPTMNGSLQYWDRIGNFKSDFVLSSQNSLHLG